MKKIFFIHLLAILIIFSAGCKKKKSDIHFDKDSITVDGANGSTGTLSIIATGDWAVSANVHSWLSISPETGSGDQTVTFTCKQNMTLTTRVANITIYDGKNNVAQQVTLTQNPFNFQSSNKILAGCAEGVMYSTNGGYSWTTKNLYGPIMSLAKSDTMIYGVAGSYGVYKSKDGNSWSVIKNDTAANSISYCNGKLFLATSNGVLISSDAGVTWTTTSVTAFINNISARNNKILAAGYYDLYYSIDNGVTWQTVTTLSKCFSSVAVSNSNFYVGTSWSASYSAFGLNKSTDNCSSWTSYTLGSNIYSVFVSPHDTIFTGSGDYTSLTKNKGLYISTNGGTTWTDQLLNNYYIQSIFYYKGYLYLGCSSGLYVSTNSGTTASPFTMDSKGIYSILVIN